MTAFKFICCTAVLSLGLGSAHAQSDELDFLFGDPETAEEPATDGPTPAPPAAETDSPSSSDDTMASESPTTTADVIPVAPLRDESEPVAIAQSAPKRQIEEIVVTAQKTEQSLQEVPLSVSALSGDFIKETGATDLADIAAYVPNVRVDTDDPGSPQMFIRGFGTNTFNPSFESSVGFVQDEIYFGRAGYFTEAMFDIARVEVLRGPQGTLFGKNTIAGVFNVVSAGPTEEFSGTVNYQTGQHGEQRIEAGIGGMLTDWLGVRVAALDQQRDGQLYNQFLNRDEEALDMSAQRLKVLLYPSDDVSMELTAVRSETSMPFWPYQLYQLDTGTTVFLRSFDPDIEDDPYNFITSMDADGYLEKGSSTVSLKTEWVLPELGSIEDFTTTLVLGNSRFYIDQLNDLDVSPADISTLDSHEDHNQQSLELRFSGRADSLFGLGTGLEFVAGVFYYDSSYELDASTIAGSELGSYALTGDALSLILGFDLGGLVLPPLQVINLLTAPLIGEDYYQFNYLQDITSTALFGQFTWYLSDHWAVTPGIRYNRESKDVSSSGTPHCRTEALFCVMQLLVGGEQYSYPDLTRDEEEVSPKIVVQYFMNDDVNFYGSFTRGYKSGGFNAISFTGEDLEYEPETAKTYELGMKGKFFDSTLQFNMTLYRTEFDNLQVLAFNGVFFDVSNAASAYSQGLEADFMWLTPFEPLTITGSLGLLEAKYDSYPEGPAPVYDGLNSLQDLSGQRIAFAPSETATLTPTLTVPVFGLVTQLAVDVLYQGDQYTDTDLDENSYVDAYTTLSARFSLANEEGTWRVSIGGSNLTDKRVLNQVTDATFFPGTYFAQQAAGRQVFGTVSFNW